MIKPNGGRRNKLHPGTIQECGIDRRDGPDQQQVCLAHMCRSQLAPGDECDLPERGERFPDVRDVGIRNNFHTNADSTREWKKANGESVAGFPVWISD